MVLRLRGQLEQPLKLWRLLSLYTGLQNGGTIIVVVQPLIFLSFWQRRPLFLLQLQEFCQFFFSAVQCRVLQGFVSSVINVMKEMKKFHSEGFCKNGFI